MFHKEKRKKFDSSNKCNYNNQNDSSDKGEGKKKYRFGDEKRKKEEEVPEDDVPSVCYP
jgi:hypothetical protein